MHDLHSLLAWTGVRLKNKKHAARRGKKCILQVQQYVDTMEVQIMGTDGVRVEIDGALVEFEGQSSMDRQTDRQEK